MKENYYIGIDLGSQNIKIILVDFKENGSQKILAKNTYPSSGISFGYITNKKLASLSLSNALKNFYKKYKIQIKDAFISIDGYGLKSENITIIQQMSNRIITDFDLEKIEEKSEKLLKKKTSDQIIHKEVVNYSLDGFEHFDSPEGLSTKRIETNLFFLTYPKNNIAILEEILEENNIAVNGYIPSVLSLQELTMQNIDKELGSLVVDYGAEKTSILLVKKNKPSNYFVIKKGSKHITELITIEEKISFSEAEKIKTTNIKKAKIKKIINQELTLLAKDIFKLIQKWDKSGILPGGVTLVGGGSKISEIQEIFKKELQLPIKKSINFNLDDFHTAYGAILLGKIEEKDDFILTDSIKNIFKPLGKILNIFKI